MKNFWRRSAGANFGYGGLPNLCGPDSSAGDQRHAFLLNELWPAHARLHEAWQLLSSAALSILCLWLVWKETRPRLASVIMLSLTGSFVIAYVARGMYGGSMLHTDGTQLMIAGTNPAIGVMVVASVALVAGLLTKSKDPLGE